MTTIPDRPVAATLAMRKAYASGQGMFNINETGDLVILDNDCSYLDPGAPTALCRGCGLIKPLACFRAKGKVWSIGTCSKPRHQPDCHICEDKWTFANAMRTIWPTKARNAIREHMNKERDEGVHTCETFEDYLTYTGLTVEWLADRMRMAWDNNDTCEHCESVGHQATWQYICPINEDGVPQLDRMTVDRINPTICLSKSNAQLLCSYGNRSKARLGEHVWAVRQRDWRRYLAAR